MGVLHSDVYALAVRARDLRQALVRSTEQVLEKERHLQRIGCDPGVVDGVFDDADLVLGLDVKSWDYATTRVDRTTRRTTDAPRSTRGWLARNSATAWPLASVST